MRSKGPRLRKRYLDDNFQSNGYSAYEFVGVSFALLASEDRMR